MRQTRLLHITIIILTTLLTSSSTFAATMKCAGGIINDSSTIVRATPLNELIRKCGEPYHADGRRLFFNIGKGEFFRTVTMNQGYVERIQKGRHRAKNDPAIDKKPEDKVWVTVRKVIDGDTIIVDKDVRIRLIGVDTPETGEGKRRAEYFGRRASDFTRELVEGKKVRLEYGWERKDRYERTLAYVFLESDGRLLNAEIIRKGYGRAYTKYPFKYLELFRELEEEARKGRRGMWKGQ